MGNPLKKGQHVSVSTMHSGSDIDGTIIEIDAITVAGVSFPYLALKTDDGQNVTMLLQDISHVYETEKPE